VTEIKGGVEMKVADLKAALAEAPDSMEVVLGLGHDFGKPVAAYHDRSKDCFVIVIDFKERKT
jgi:hypothetical protein